jgi:tetratricopeptide (TPR) repeat protein
MRPEAEDEHRSRKSMSLFQLAWLAAVLGLGTWLLSTFLFPARVPDDFPQLPNIQALSPGLRTLLAQADNDARKHPRSAEAVGKLGIAYHANEYFEQAGNAYRIAARLAPGDAQWVYCEAVLQEESGNQKEQFKFLQDTVRLRPDHVPALLKLADGYFKQDNLDEAGRNYELAAKASDKSSYLPAAFGLARVAARRGEWEKAIQYVVPLSRDYPFVRPPFQLLQDAYQALGQADNAAKVRETIASGKFTDVPPVQDPLNDRLAEASYSSTRLLKQAGLLSRFGYPDRGIQIARRAAEANPADPDIRDYIAHTLLTFYGDKPEPVDEALTQLAECLRLKPADLAPLWSFTNDFFEKPKTAQAIQRLSSLLAPYAGQPEAHFYLGLVADAQGDAREAITQYRAALKNSPNDSRIYNKLGLMFGQTDQYEAAVAYFRKSLQLNPANSVARFNLGVTLMQRRNYADGMKEVGEVLRLHPQDAAANFCMGFAYLFTNRAGEAVASFRQGLRYKPEDAEAHYGLGSALSIQRDRDGAAAELREALKLRPNYPEAQELLERLGR